MLLISMLCSLLTTAQKNPVILKIRENFQIWQPIIEKESSNSTKLFHYAWGENYQEEDWYENEQKSENKFLFQKVSVIKKDSLGTFVHHDDYSMSGDWNITADYYFDTNDQLYFIYWRMNTFQATEPVTVEKRLYFDTDEQLIRNLESKYKLNTKEESTAEFADREVAYELRLNNMSFYKKLTQE
ncbi:MAG: hypothetical protein AAFQ94_15595 [Bacteroidota bacterium]